MNQDKLWTADSFRAKLFAFQIKVTDVQIQQTTGYSQFTSLTSLKKKKIENLFLLQFAYTTCGAKANTLITSHMSNIL